MFVNFLAKLQCGLTFRFGRLWIFVKYIARSNYWTHAVPALSFAN